MSSSFWKEALARLPQHVQHRHAGAFEAAERFEQVLDFAWETGRRISRRLARYAPDEPARAAADQRLSSLTPDFRMTPAHFSTSRLRKSAN